MVASFITAGVLNQELFFKSGRELLLVWERVQHVVPLMRVVYKNPAVLQDLETVAKAFIEFMKRQGPDAYDAFAAQVK